MDNVRLISATGQIIQTISVQANQSAINVADLLPGVYYLMIEIDGELKPQRFVKQ